MAKGLGLGGAYDTTIRRIKAQEGDRARLGMDALMWISHSERPLNVDEICHALAIETGSTEMNAKSVPAIRTVLSCCQGLAVIDEGSSTIRLIHFTLKEYFSRHDTLFDRPHSRIAETCLTYLNFRAIKDLSVSSFHDFRGPPLLKYSSLNWGTHMRMGLSSSLGPLALKFLGRFDNHISSELLWVSLNGRWIADNLKSLRPFSALHCVSYFGIAEVAIDLIKMKRWDVNKRDSIGLTPLMWAARHGREEVVKLLLQQKHIHPDIRDAEHGHTALSWAARCGHEGVVRIFLGPLFVNPGSIGRLWGTPQAMSLLFGRKYINPDNLDRYGRTPLSRATKGGHDGVVRLLLGREDVSPDRLDSDGQTLLSWAASGGHDGVVRLLLGREDVSPDGTDNYGRTPLSWAASGGHDRVVRLLLERKDVSPDRPSNNGRTPLSWAAKYGRDGVVKLLLEREDVSPNRPSNGGRTPLLWAASGGHDGVVRLLLGREDVSPDRPSNSGRTPLLWAASGGHDGVVRLLLGREDVSPDRVDDYGQTPLSWAASGGHDRVVKLLLEREDVSPDRPDNSGRTPLRYAAQSRNDTVVKLLKARMATAPTYYKALRYNPSRRL